jgi:hydroxymethylglutaryl-CoA synthase
VDNIGIVGYGSYIPRSRIKVEDIVNIWRNTTTEIQKERLNSYEKAVVAPDEDTITVAFEAARNALCKAEINAEELGAVYLGSCTSPYASKSSAAVISEAIGTKQEIMCADIQFSGKSGTAAMQVCLALVRAGMINYGLAIGSDDISSRTQPSDRAECQASVGSAAIIIGKSRVLAEIEDTCSYTSDTTDLFRVDGDRYIRYGGSIDLGKIGYEKHTIEASRRLMEKLGREPKDYAFAVFQQPSGARPFAVGEALGFTKEQITLGNLAPEIGDCGAASSLLGLNAVLDQAQSNDRILLTSYGFGAGSDAFSLLVTDEVKKKRKSNSSVKSQISNRKYIDYATYLKFERKYVREY